jgi:hypothetical protein
VAYVTGVIYLLITIFDLDPYIRGLYTTFTIFYYLSIKKFKLQKIFWAFLFSVTFIEFYINRVHPTPQTLWWIRFCSIVILLVFTAVMVFFQRTIIFRSSRYDYWSVTYLVNLRHFFYPNSEKLDELLAGAKDISRIRKFKYDVHHQLNAHLARFQGLANVMDLQIRDNEIEKAQQTAFMMQTVAAEIRKEILLIVNEFYSELEKDMTND